MVWPYGPEDAIATARANPATFPPAPWWETLSKIEYTVLFIGGAIVVIGLVFLLYRGCPKLWRASARAFVRFTQHRALAKLDAPLFQHLVATQLAVLQGMDDEEIAVTLDMASRIKDASIVADSIPRQFFTDPLMVPDKQRLVVLADILSHMQSLQGDLQGMAKVGGMTWWVLSGAAYQFPELRKDVREVWGEAERAFGHCQLFKAAQDVPKGLGARVV